MNDCQSLRNGTLSQITLEILFLLYVRRNPEWNARAIGTGGHHLIASEDEDLSPAYRDDSDRVRAGVDSGASQHSRVVV